MGSQKRTRPVLRTRPKLILPGMDRGGNYRPGAPLMDFGAGLRVRTLFCSYQFENRDTAMKEALRVFSFRMLAVKNSPRARLPRSSKRRNRDGRLPVRAPTRARWRDEIISWVMSGEN